MLKYRKKQWYSGSQRRQFGNGLSADSNHKVATVVMVTLYDRRMINNKQ